LRKNFSRLGRIIKHLLDISTLKGKKEEAQKKAEEEARKKAMEGQSSKDVQT
jgi:hypothetical protein